MSNKVFEISLCLGVFIGNFLVRIVQGGTLLDGISVGFIAATVLLFLIKVPFRKFFES